MARPARHLFLPLALLAACAWAQPSPEATIQRRGFEYRPHQPVNWGTKPPAPQRLTWVEANNVQYEIDAGVPVPLGQAREFIRAYLQQHAHRQVGLIAELSHGATPSFEPVLANPTIGRYAARFEQAPIFQYQAMYRRVKVLNDDYDVSCRLMFIEHFGALYLVYRRWQEPVPAQSVEPRCSFHDAGVR